MAVFAVVGITALPATSVFAQDSVLDVERNNEIEQSIEQDQEACTNEAEAEIEDEDFVQIGGGNEATVGQANVCDVTQTQTAANVADIVDESDNVLEGVVAWVLIRD